MTAFFPLRICVQSAPIITIFSLFAVFLFLSYTCSIRIYGSSFTANVAAWKPAGGKVIATNIVQNIIETLCEGREKYMCVKRLFPRKRTG